MQILVVDDESLIRWSLAEVLADSGHQVEEAGDGASAVALLSEHHPFDVVLLDYRLPDSNDLGLLAEEIDTANGEQLGNFPQAFSHIGLITAAYEIDKARGLA